MQYQTIQGKTLEDLFEQASQLTGKYSASLEGTGNIHHLLRTDYDGNQKYHRFICRFVGEVHMPFIRSYVRDSIVEDVGLDVQNSLGAHQIILTDHERTQVPKPFSNIDRVLPKPPIRSTDFYSSFEEFLDKGKITHLKLGVRDKGYLEYYERTMGNSSHNGQFIIDKKMKTEEYEHMESIMLEHLKTDPLKETWQLSVYNQKGEVDHKILLGPNKILNYSSGPYR